MNKKTFIARLSTKNQVVIPKKIREVLKIGPGDYIAFIIEDDKIILRKARITFNS